jgi:2-polyprenyl-3-methyl-5-hydroxy-6-metoxy-1,4-benzoquinol methylase
MAPNSYLDFGASYQYTPEAGMILMFPAYLSLLDKIRQQFDTGPYPRIPLEQSPKDEPTCLYIHNFLTPYYLRNQKVIAPEGISILDAGCGTGYTSLILAEANPGAKVVGIDLSEQSINLARERLQYHGFTNINFHAITLEEVTVLEQKFDYINCHEVLYLLPDPVVGLQAMKSVLKPKGIIRTNLHDSIGRAEYFRAQKIFSLMGFMDDNPREMEITRVQETMKALKDQVRLKAEAWRDEFEGNEEAILANYLLQGDKGSTIPELFSALRAADLEFISMVNWRQWELMDLFKNPDDLPVFLGLTLPEISVEERLHLFELLHPIHRLVDFWCGHPNQSHPFVPVAEWMLSDWQGANVHLHPQLKTPGVKEELLRCITQLNPFEISRQLPITGEVLVDSTIAACLLPLWEEAQSMQSLVERWQKLRPVHPVTLEPTTFSEAFEIVSASLMGLESSGYVLLERHP